MCSPLSVRYSAIEMTYVVITKKEKVEKMCRVARCLRVHWLDFFFLNMTLEKGRVLGCLERVRSGCLAHRLILILLRLMMVEEDSCFYVAFGKMRMFNAETGD